MKLKYIIIALILFVQQYTKAQDTMYVWQKKGVVSKFAVKDIDSLVFVEPEVLTDVDGNVYRTVKIGNQTWMAENLKVTKYRNGDMIGTTTSANLDISTMSSPKYQWAYGGNETNVDSYGRLYTWHTINDSRDVCPAGWRVPADSDWNILEDYIGEPGNAGGMLKAVGLNHWESPNTEATDSFGFTALPGGDRTPDGTFENASYIGSWWSFDSYNSISAGTRNMSHATASVDSHGKDKAHGLSIRCIKGSN